LTLAGNPKSTQSLAPTSQRSLKVSKNSRVRQWEANKRVFSKEFLTPDTLGAGKSTVEVGCGANQRKMSEGLRKIPKMPSVGAYLF